MIIVLPEMTMRRLMTNIVEAVHGLGDDLGNVWVAPTISEAQLRQAAMVAVQIATGEPIWPGDRVIKIRRANVRHGIFEEER